MKVSRAVRSFCFSLPIVAAVTRQPDARAQCGQRCEMLKVVQWAQQEIQKLQQTLDWLSDELAKVPDSSFATSFVPLSVSPTSTSTSSTVRWSNTSSLHGINPNYTPATTTASALGYYSYSNTKSSFSPPPEPTETMGGGDGYRSVAYFTNWGIYGRAYTPDKIPADKLTHILYAFADNRDDGTVFLTDPWSDIDKHYANDSWNDSGKNVYGSIKQLNIAKKRNRNLKVLLSIGGWTYTNTQKHFDGPASTPEGRKNFANSCVQLIKDLGLDGIDIDWEYPQNPGQGEQLLLLLQEIRNAMDHYSNNLTHAGNTTEYGSQGKPHFLLSIAAPAGKSNYQNLPLGRIGAAVDFINIMGYDFAGAWDSVAGHQANLYASKSCPSCTPFNIQQVISDYVAEGVPSDKLVLGMPLYGRAFTNTTGFGQPFSGVGEGSWENGIWDYKVLPKPGATEHYDEEAGASYSYDPNSKTLISYDTVDMAKRKAAYIKQHHLGGAMWWELSGDRADDSGSIITNVVKELGGYDGKRLEYSPNWLTYPDSQYDNLREGFPNDA